MPESQGAIRQSFAPIVKRVAPAVVNVYVRRRIEQRQSPFFADPFFRRFFGENFGIPRERVQSSLGSGVIVDKTGIVVTNAHVIAGAGGDTDITIALADGREFATHLMMKDPQSDLAVLRLASEAAAFPWLEFADSDALEVGDLVLAIGNPFGVGQTVTSGIVSAVARTQVGISDYQFFIQTDAAINPGNSGGALVGIDGRVVGINSAIFSQSGGSQGIGFAIPANMVKLVVQSALKGGKIHRPWFGAQLQPVTSDIANSLGLDRPAGAIVQGLSKDGPAAKAGLKVGDVILNVDGKPVLDPNGFTYRFVTRGIGGKAELGLMRDGQVKKATVELAAAPEIPPRNEKELDGEQPLQGARVANLSPAVAEELGDSGDAQGVVVLDVSRNSLAARVGLQRGDLILALNGRNIESVEQLETTLSRRASGWRLAIGRGGRRLELVIGG